MKYLHVEKGKKDCIQFYKEIQILQHLFHLGDRHLVN